MKKNNFLKRSLKNNILQRGDTWKILRFDRKIRFSFFEYNIIFWKKFLIEIEKINFAQKSRKKNHFLKPRSIEKILQKERDSYEKIIEVI